MSLQRDHYYTFNLQHEESGWLLCLDGIDKRPHRPQCLPRREAAAGQRVTGHME